VDCANENQPDAAEKRDDDDDGLQEIGHCSPPGGIVPHHSAIGASRAAAPAAPRQNPAAGKAAAGSVFEWRRSMRAAYWARVQVWPPQNRPPKAQPSTRSELVPRSVMWDA